MGEIKHIPVMTGEIISILSKVDKLSYVIDATIGLGGHAFEILSSFSEVRLLGIDQDDQALAVAAQRLECFGERVLLLKSNFKHIDEIVKTYLKEEKVDAILFDLGVSSLQLDDEERGFSFNKEGPIDMRMDKDATVTACDLVNKLTYDELSKIFYEYGEERFSRLLAKAIVRHRDRYGQISSTSELVDIIRGALPAKVQRRTGKHPARRIFQALRIAVNDELNALEMGLEKSLRCVRSGGTIVVLSYHSLEDRRVKHAFKRWKSDGLGSLYTKKPISPKEEEIKSNPRSRSAKLRAFVKF